MNTLKKATKIDIYGLNRINEISMNLVEQIIPQLKGYLNEKIITKSDRPLFLSKIKFNYNSHPVNEKEGDHFNTTTAHIDLSYGSNIWLKVKTCLNGGEYDAKPYSTYYCQYFEKTIYIGEIKEQILTQLKETEDIILDNDLSVKLDYEFINCIITEYNEMIDKAGKIKNSLPYYLRK